MKIGSSSTSDWFTPIFGGNDSGKVDKFYSDWLTSLKRRSLDHVQ